MFCENCGAEKYSEEGNFCTKCGYQFSEKNIGNLKDDYQINFDIAVITGLGSGVITGVFSATISQTFTYSPLTWLIIYILVGIFIIYLLISRYASFAHIFKKRIKKIR